MDFTLGPAAFSLPDDWRDNSTYVYKPRGGAGMLLLEVERQPRASAELLEAARQAFLGVWGPVVIYHKEFALRRPTEPKMLGEEGERSPIDATGRHRFALVPLVSAGWSAAMTFVLPPRPDFLALVRAVVESFAFADEPPPPALRGPQRHRYRAYGAQLDLEGAWTPPATLQFMDPDRDAVELTVTLEEPMVAPGTVRWPSHVTGPIKILRETLSGGPDAWTGEWSLERPPRYPSPFLFRKSATLVGAGRVVTVFGSAPEADARRLDAGWNAVQASLHAAGGG